ncbi:MAG: tetratricopeptide repeat protein [Polyangiales bacterium]
MRSLIFAIVVAAVPATAFADDPKAEAKAHIERASALHEEGKHVEALAELKTAYALDPQPQLLFAMGQSHVQLGECTQAISYYQRFLAAKPSAAQARVTNEAIEACKTNPPPAVNRPPTEPEPPPPPPTSPTPSLSAYHGNVSVRATTAGGGSTTTTEGVLGGAVGGGSGSLGGRFTAGGGFVLHASIASLVTLACAEDGLAARNRW